MMCKSPWAFPSHGHSTSMCSCKVAQRGPCTVGGMQPHINMWGCRVQWSQHVLYTMNVFCCAEREGQALGAQWI